MAKFKSENRKPKKVVNKTEKNKPKTKEKKQSKGFYYSFLTIILFS